MRDILFTVRGERLIPSSASLGKVGDVSAVECVLDVSEWLERWPDAVISVVMVTPDKNPYILAAAVTPTMGKVSFELEDILKQSGGYYIEARALEDGREAISGSSGRLTVLPNILGDKPGEQGKPPGWVDEVISKISDATENANRAESARVKSEQAAQDAADAAEKAEASQIRTEKSEQSAKRSAELAQQAAESKGFFYVEGREDGKLYLISSDNAPDDFSLVDREGVLIAVYG